MDEVDRKILKLLQANARMSLKSIAEKTFLSSPAVSARIERLEKEGVITGYHAQLDPVKLGYHILAFINLDVRPEDKPKFYAYADEMPNILECSYVKGRLPEHQGAGSFYRTASEIWEDQHPDRIFHPCGPQGCGGGTSGGLKRSCQHSDETGIWCYRSAIL